MPKYRVLEKSFIDNTLVEEGKIVNYDGPPGKNLEPIDDEAQAAAAAAAATAGPKGLSVNDLTRQTVAAHGGDPEAVDLAVAASAASAAASAVIDGKTVSVDGKPVELPNSDMPKPVDQSAGLV